VNGAIFRWSGLLLGQGVILTGLILTYLSTRSTRTKVDGVDSKVDTAAVEARKAARAVEPISNGFAGHTTESLSSLNESVTELRDLLIRHISDHASSDVLTRKKD
jgi:hypothetical protein